MPNPDIHLSDTSAMADDNAENTMETDAEPTIEALQAELAEAGDKLLRSQAELENYRKRARRELEDSLRYASLPVVRDLLPVIDNLSRAIAAAEKAADSTGLIDGVKLVVQSLEAALAKHGIKRIEALGQPFDPAVHEAIGQQPSTEYPPQTVMLVAQEGYTLHDRVVRPAQVIISSAPAT
jgi:molecular chaperone GrpE